MSEGIRLPHLILFLVRFLLEGVDSRYPDPSLWSPERQQHLRNRRCDGSMLRHIELQSVEYHLSDMNLRSGREKDKRTIHVILATSRRHATSLQQILICESY